jgi:hypothetical protein
MVTLCLGDCADPVGEGHRVGKAREVEYPLEPGDAAALQKLPAWDFAPELRDLRLGRPRRVAAQATHRSVDSVLIAHTSEFLFASRLCSPDPVFGVLHALDALELKSSSTRYAGGSTETRWTIVPSASCTFWLKATPLIVRPLRFTFTRWFGSNAPEPPEDITEREQTIQHRREPFFPARRNA